MNGIIVINKEKDYTSNDVVQIVKKIFKEKVGHTGTLDPMATGVLPLLVGKGTMCSKYLINHDKKYIATLKLGIKTDTGDITGKVIESKPVDKNVLNIENVKNVLNEFVGEQEQVPPMYSAIKIKGKKLYEYARKNEKIDVPSRKITIYDINLNSIENSQIKFEVSCSKGTYIRTLCENIAEKLNTVGTMCELNRTQVGIFSIKDSVTINKLKENFDSKDFMDKYFISIEDLFTDKDKIVLNDKQYNAFLNGVKLLTNKEDGAYKIYDLENEFIGIGVVKDRKLKRDIVVS